MVVTQFAIVEAARDIGIEKELEQHTDGQARLIKCAGIQIYGMDLLTRIQQFYLLQGYQEQSKYFPNRLFYGE